MAYRKEIDGLRAVAVIPVILFHAGFQAFSGGFVGVDVFFVISGYLITTIILAEQERGTFSLVDFYERRTRRILPALFFVMLVSLIGSWFWLLAADMEAFSQSLMAVSTFSSNIFFWRTSGYWGADTELLPLLHTWSLAVEEQYYLIFPLFLMAMWRFRKRWILSALIVVAVISLLLAQWGAYNRPTATFFILVTRAWELAIGAIIAFHFLYRQQNVSALTSNRYIDEALSVVGLLMIGYSIFVFDKTVPFPSFYTLIPTVGTGLIILFCTSNTAVGRLLGLKSIVGIGLISYSAYLWHQPLFAFARYRSMAGPSTLLLSSLAILSMVLAYMSWRYVEKPFRTKGVFSRRAIFTFAGVGSAFFIVVGLLGNFNDGWPDRMGGKIQATIESAKLKHFGDELCLTDYKLPNAPNDLCALVKSDNSYAYLMGDSHAIAITTEMKNTFEQKNIGLIKATERGCPPVQDVYVYESESDKLRCFNHNQAVYRYLQSNENIEYVVLVARWAFYLEAMRFNNGEGGIEHVEKLHFDTSLNDKRDQISEQDRLAYYSQAYTDSVQKIAALGKKVILVYPIPEAGWDVPRYVRNYYLADPEQAFSVSTGSTSYQVFLDRNKRAYQALDAAGEFPNLVRVYPETTFCANDVEQRCIVQKNEDLLYGDDDHLTNAGAMLVINEVIRHLD